MIETVINYHPQYLSDENGAWLTFAFDPDSTDLFRSPAGGPLAAPDGEFYTVRGAFLRDSLGALAPSSGGAPFRMWRSALDPELNPGRKPWSGINNPDEIWDEIVAASRLPGTTSAPKLQPIEARIVMLQSGMRAPMGVKVKGPDLESIESAALAIEAALKEVPSVQPATVNADRVVGKPYLEIRIDREKIARYGITVEAVQRVVMTAVGGMPVTTTVEGRERYPVRVRYMRELRDNLESLGKILVSAPGGTQVPLGQLAEVVYVRGPQVIKSEDTFLVAYVTFDRVDGAAEVNVVEQAQNYLAGQISSGSLKLPPGVSYTFAGSYENQLRSQRTLSVVMPLALLIIFLILYMQFGRVPVTALVFSGIVLAWAGGFILLWLYGQSWFLNFSVFGVDMRQLFQIGPVNLSVAVWVGFLALFGIASDDGVIMSTYLTQVFESENPGTVDEIRRATLKASARRLRPCTMTIATTILALIPVLTSTGRGSDIMVPMAIPSVGGMVFVFLSLFMVPVLYAWLEERKLAGGEK
jgi:Cu(I)/Ag(I) efflux system membrane protein CusA/SilA